jgi:hypothetical protein
LKATNFEIKSLLTRRKDVVLYAFNLLTVFEGNMYEANAGNNIVNIKETKNVKYVNRFIIDNNESFYRLQFCRKEYFLELLNCYDQYFKKAYTLFCSAIDDYYVNCLDNEKYLYAFKGKISSEIKSILKIYLNDIENQPHLDFLYNKTDNKMIVCLPWARYKDDEINSLNTVDWLKKDTSAIFHKYFRCHCSIEFAEEPPF